LVEHYTQNLAGRRDVALIQVSMDNDRKAAAGWAKEAKFPWLTIMMTDRDGRRAPDHDFTQVFSPRGIPSYILISADGEKIAEGKNAVFAALDQEAP
jgi:hypothetical protein